MRLIIIAVKDFDLKSQIYSKITTDYSTIINDDFSIKSFIRKVKDSNSKSVFIQDLIPTYINIFSLKRCIISCYDREMIAFYGIEYVYVSIKGDIKKEQLSELSMVCELYTVTEKNKKITVSCIDNHTSIPLLKEFENKESFFPNGFVMLLFVILFIFYAVSEYLKT